MHKIILAAAAAAIPTGCVGPSAESAVIPNRAVTDLLDDGVTVLGRYDPAGFSAADAGKMAG
ncbi:MAG: hypothetical protein AAF761_09175 [Pseudomonadota bacterium]